MSEPVLLVFHEESSAQTMGALNIDWWEEQIYPEVTPSTGQNEFAEGNCRFREKTRRYRRQ